MNILVTGAFGQIGSKVLKELAKSNFQVRCFDLKNRQTRKVARKYKKAVEVFWGGYSK